MIGSWTVDSYKIGAYLLFSSLYIYNGYWLLMRVNLKSAIDFEDTIEADLRLCDGGFEENNDITFDMLLLFDLAGKID